MFNWRVGAISSWDMNEELIWPATKPHLLQARSLRDWSRARSISNQVVQIKDSIRDWTSKIVITCYWTSKIVSTGEIWWKRTQFTLYYKKHDKLSCALGVKITLNVEYRLTCTWIRRSNIWVRFNRNCPSDSSYMTLLLIIIQETYTNIGDPH